MTGVARGARSGRVSSAERGCHISAISSRLVQASAAASSNRALRTACLKIPVDFIPGPGSLEISHRKISAEWGRVTRAIALRGFPAALPCRKCAKIILLLLHAGPVTAQNQREAGLELVPLADASGSIEAEELAFQWQGYARAVTDPADIAAMENSICGTVVVI
ncbi:MAG: DUF1194 domain-containing protein [Sulfitobacter sp.]|nr:DUF1194 domain-containing protein [Sulfitobacter sp.]